MKLLNFTVGGQPFFGLAVGEFALSFAQLQRSAGGPDTSGLTSMEAYLQGLPETFAQATRLHDHALSLLEAGRGEGLHRLADVKILPPIQRPAALIDFGLTPKHLVNSAKTLLHHEFGPVLGALVAPFLARGIVRKSRSPILMYYKGNHLTVIGDDDEMGWPNYASYVDIEPELAFVTGGEAQPIAGYLVYNDASARDVQFPEMMGTGPARSKDFVNGNGLGPFFVTPDEIPDPLGLKVTAKVGTRFEWHGHTSEYTAHPEKVAAFLRTVYPNVPGIVVGMGTIPGCTGLDNDLWIRPGESIEITIEGLGTLRQRVPAQLPKLEPSRWKARTDF
jgi:hypothetical protein